MTIGTKIVMVLALALLLLAGGFYFVNQKGENGMGGASPFSLDGLFGKKESGDEEAMQAAAESPTGDVVVESGDSSLPLTYQNKQFGFELNIPLGYTGSSFTEGFGVTALLQNPESGESFQMYIAPFDEEGSLSVERIQEDLPELKISEPQVALIADKQIEALIFIGESEDFGKTREVWFVHDGQLYQVIAPFEMEQTVGPIMESLRFAQ